MGFCLSKCLHSDMAAELEAELPTTYALLQSSFGQDPARSRAAASGPGAPA